VHRTLRPYMERVSRHELPYRYQRPCPGNIFSLQQCIITFVALKLNISYHISSKLSY
jgi:hypothetical protein